MKKLEINIPTTRQYIDLFDQYETPTHLYYSWKGMWREVVQVLGCTEHTKLWVLSDGGVEEDFLALGLACETPGSPPFLFEMDVYGDCQWNCAISHNLARCDPKECLWDVLPKVKPAGKIKEPPKRWELDGNAVAKQLRATLKKVDPKKVRLTVEIGPGGIGGNVTVEADRPFKIAYADLCSKRPRFIDPIFEGALAPGIKVDVHTHAKVDAKLAALQRRARAEFATARKKWRP